MIGSLRLVALDWPNSRFDGIPKLSKEKFLSELTFGEEDKFKNDDSSFHTCASRTSLLSSLFTDSASTNTIIAGDNPSLSLSSSLPPAIPESKSSPVLCQWRPTSSSAASSPALGKGVFSPRPITRSCFANLDNPREDFILRPGSFPSAISLSPTLGQPRTLGPGYTRVLQRASAPAPAPLPFPCPPLPPLPTEIATRPRPKREDSRPRMTKSMSFLPKVYFSSVFISDPPASAAQTELTADRSTTTAKLFPQPSHSGSRRRSRSRSRPSSTHEKTDYNAWTIRKRDSGRTGRSSGPEEQPSSRKTKKDKWASSVGRFAGRLGLKRQE